MCAACTLVSVRAQVARNVTVAPESLRIGGWDVVAMLYIAACATVGVAWVITIARYVRIARRYKEERDDERQVDLYYELKEC